MRKELRFFTPDLLLFTPYFFSLYKKEATDSLLFFVALFYTPGSVTPQNGGMIISLQRTITRGFERRGDWFDGIIEGSSYPNPPCIA